jgi:DNA-binding response OmpR family regulator
MKNICLNIFGSKFFFNLIKELSIDYNINYLEHKSLNLREDLLRNDIKIIFPESLSLNEIKDLINYNSPIIFLLNDKKYFEMNKLKLLDFHLFLVLPIDLLSFMQILKILITKYSFFNQSKIILNNYEIDSNQRIVRKGNINIKLTEKEIKLILALHKENGLKKTHLLAEVWNYNSNLDSHAFETHLHRLRKKFEKIFNDKKFIIEKNSRYYLC